MRPAALFLAALALGTPPLRGDTYPRQPGVDALHYVFRLTLSDETDEIAAEAAIDVRFVAAGLTGFALDLASVANGKGMTVIAVTSNGSPLPHTHESNRLRIALPQPPEAGERRVFTVRYRGLPGAGLRIGPNKFGERTFFGLNWPDLARHWLPMIDHPYDKASSEFIVTAPSHYQVVANGLLVEETDLAGERRETHWKQSAPIASWLNAIGVARFAVRHFGVVRGIPLQTWVFHQERDAGIATFEAPTRRALEFFAERVGPYPYEKLANVVAAGLAGGTEHASVIMYGEKVVTGRPATNLVAHEIAHQWFGDSVTEKDWDDVWLSEGFATYFTLLATEHHDGRDAFVAGLKRSRDNILAFEKKTPGLPVVHDNLADMRRVLNPLVYQKGGWTLHMLRGVVGTDRFWAGIRDYYARYRDGNASTADFRRVIEEASGMDLDWFFRQWLNRAGSPVIEWSWRYDAAAKRIEIEFEQTQPGEPYRLPLELGVTSAGAPQIQLEKLDLQQKKQRFHVAAEKEPAAVLLDPNTWTLMEARLVTP